MHQIPRELVRAASERLGLRAAVETGTYLGDTAAWLRGLFRQVWSIELSEELHKMALDKYGEIEGLTFVQGSSAETLPAILTQIGEPALFWLDGHFSSGTIIPTGGADKQCPVLEEIESIDDHAFSGTSVILIDDARLFLGPPPPPYRREDWPTFLSLLNALRARFPRYVTVLGDVIIAGPPEIQPLVDEYWLDVLRRGEDARQLLIDAENPNPVVAAKRLIKSVIGRQKS